MKAAPFLVLALLLAACSAPASRPPSREAASAGSFAPASSPRIETSLLANGLTVVLLEDHARPEVVVDTWFAVGSRDDPPGQGGLALLLARLLNPDAARSPAGELERELERHGASTHAGCGLDHTALLGMGPPAALPALLRQAAGRIASLPASLTRERLDRERERVRDELRRNAQNVPCAGAALLLPASLYPAGHPYHSVTGHGGESAPELAPEDALAFFRESYPASNATLVVAGDFEPAEARALIARTLGALELRPAARQRGAGPVVLTGERSLVERARVDFQRLTLAWHSPAVFSPGDAELELAASILAEGPSSRLEQRLVLDTRLAREVDAVQLSAELGSVFQVEILAAPDADLERIEAEVLDALAELACAGPDAQELAEAQRRQEARFKRRTRGLLARAEAIQAYRRHFGVSDGSRRDLERWTRASREGVSDALASILARGRVALHLLPEGRGAPEPAESPEALRPELRGSP